MNPSDFITSFKNNFIDSELNVNAKKSFVNNFNNIAENQMIDITVEKQYPGNRLCLI